MARKMTTAERFFYDHAGFSYDPKTETRQQSKLRCALELAAAETWMKSRGMSFTTVDDLDADLSWMDAEERQQEHSVIGIVLLDADGKRFTSYSLWGIVDADSGYIRVVVAELASEAMCDEATAAERVLTSAGDVPMEAE